MVSHIPMNHGVQAVVAHKGAREHFLAARALHRNGQLAALVTDWYSPLPARWAGCLASVAPWAARALGAASAELPRSRVLALNGFGLRSRWQLQRADRAGRLLEAMAADDEVFARRVAQMRLPPHNVFLGFSYAALETLRAERSRGVLTLVDQIDPGRLEWDLLQEESARWPDYADPLSACPSGYYERAEAEWQTADIVLVNSAWSRDAIVQRGADRNRVEIIPLAYEAQHPSTKPPQRRDGPLTVLWLGSVILRKGIPYLLEAAKQLAGEPVQFVIAGPLGVRPDIFRNAPSSVRWVGAVPRSEAEQMYRRADVFILPTLSDGFAITQVEALAHGLPVIVTPNCGEVVEDGHTGFIVPPRDVAALAQAIRRFIRDPGLAASMRNACLASADRFSIAAYARRLNEIINKGLASRSSGTASSAPILPTT